MPRPLALAAFLLVSTAGASPPTHAPGDAPPELRPAVERADAAIAAFQRRLQGRLFQAMAAGGPAEAVRVCREEARAIAGEVSAETGVRLGRTSDRLRNDANAAPDWAAELVAAAAGKRAAVVDATVVELGARVGVLRPITVVDGCLRCHGPVEGMAEEARSTIGEAYPNDRATGYASGDHRGFFWAEVER
jgi:hypothetical protein